MIRYWQKHGVYFAESNFGERAALKDAGFVWDKIVRKHWATHDPDVAGKLARYADPVCQARLAKAKQERSTAIYASMAHDSTWNFPVPDGLEYLPYQKAGIEYMIGLPSSLCADDMGLGKTIESIGVVNAVPDEFRHILVFTKATLKINWKREFEKWSVRPLHIEIVNGTFPHADVVIINYDIAMKYYDYIRSEKWDMIIIDEAHQLTNPKALRTRAIFGGKSIPRDPVDRTPIEAKKKIALDGTPIKNWVKELFGLLHYLDPQTWYSFKRYIQEYSGIHNNGWGNDYSGSNLSEEERLAKAEALQRKLRSTLMIRRLKKDVLPELPPVRYQIIELPCPAQFRDLITQQLNHYDAAQSFINQMQQRVKDAQEAGNKEEYEAALRALGEGKSAAFKEIAKMRHDVGIAKLDMVKQYVKDVLGEIDEKLIVFGHHRDVLEEINNEFKHLSVLVYGGQDDTNRQVSIDTFQADPSCRLFVGSIRAAGEGITLTASSKVIFSEFDWTPGQMEQCIARSNRIGQTADSLLVTYLVLEGSLDARQISVFVEKQKIIDKAMNHDSMSMEAKAQ